MIKKIPLSEIIEPSLDIRNEHDIDSITELAESIKAVGLLQPIVVRKQGEQYEIIAGHRRFLAHRQLGVDKIEAKVLNLEEEDTILARVHENIHRLDITALEEAQIVGYLHYELKWEMVQIASQLRKSKGWVESRIDILHMQEDIKTELSAKKITIAVATELMKVNDELKRKYFLEMAVMHGATWRQVQQWRVDFQKENFTPHEGTLPPSPLVISTTPSQLTVTCFICETGHHAARMMAINICQGCWSDLYKYKKNPQTPSDIPTS